MQARLCVSFERPSRRSLCSSVTHNRQRSSSTCTPCRGTAPRIQLDTRGSWRLWRIRRYRKESLATAYRCQRVRLASHSMLLTPLQDVLSQPAVVSNDDLGHALAMVVSAASTVLLEVGDIRVEDCCVEPYVRAREDGALLLRTACRMTAMLAQQMPTLISMKDQVLMGAASRRGCRLSV